MISERLLEARQGLCGSPPDRVLGDSLEKPVAPCAHSYGFRECSQLRAKHFQIEVASRE